jgi:hypothetical protein
MGNACSHVDHDVDRNVSDEKLVELRAVALSDASEAFASERAKLERTVAELQQVIVKSRAQNLSYPHFVCLRTDAGCTLGCTRSRSRCRRTKR